MSSNSGAATPVLSLDAVTFSYGASAVLRDVTMTIREGEMVALLGPNGAGKSTLLRLLSGVLNPSSGTVRLGGVLMSRIKRKVVARQLAVAPQTLHVPFAFTVREVVSMGRTAHIAPLQGETSGDVAAIDRALHAVHLTDMSGRTFDSLSGGEQQRAILAMALAQEPRVLLLDEPTVHLDLSHQLAVLQRVREMRQHMNLTVVATVHDVNLAALLFDRCVLLTHGEIVADGRPADVLSAATIAAVFGITVSVYDHPISGAPQITLLP